jgi:Fe-S oxidoreductase
MRLAVGLGMTVVAAVVAGRRLWWLARLLRMGQPAPGRFTTWPSRMRAELWEVAGQRKLLQWSVPGVAHFLTFWGFLVLGATIIESYGALFDENFHLPLIGRQLWLGVLEDVFTVAVALGVAAFAGLRLRHNPARHQRSSRFYGSHTRAAWIILGMILLVLTTLVVYRGAQVNTGNFPWGRSGWPFLSHGMGAALAGLGTRANHAIETSFILAQIAVILVFLVIVVYSKHLHIFLAPINVAAKRLPKALGAAQPMASRGVAIDFADPGEDDLFGRGAIEDFTWKGLLDFATCTECGRCQDQCPAWNTGKPLSPKLLIMDLRDHLFAKAPYLLGDGDAASAAEADRPLIGEIAAGGVIEPDVLWSCTTCGACVEQCPVDIEHVDHILDIRRHQVLVDADFPSELAGMFRNLETQGNPWGVKSSARLDWAQDLPFTLRVADDEIPDDVDYLFWVGCAGAFDDRAQKTTRAVAELLHIAGVEFMVLGDGESCTGDPARRSGNEFLFQMLAQQAVEALTLVKAQRIVVTCPHCFNTIRNEFPQLDGRFEVIHHTQLLNRLVRDGRLIPISRPEQKVTYHDPCYLGRHNEVYEPPRELVSAVPGARLVEMPRHAQRSFCCGAGGARMWMEERIGTRVNSARAEEALATGADAIATGCPFCKVMLTDGVSLATGSGSETPVVDVAQLLLDGVRRHQSSAEPPPPTGTSQG